MKNIYTYIIVVVLAFFIMLGGYFAISKESTQTAKPTKTNEIILYYGSTCPHCKNVEEFLSKNKNIEAKIRIEKKEVSENKQNAIDMQNKADICEVDSSNGLSVPFFYYKGECIVGSDLIINFLTEKAK